MTVQFSAWDYFGPMLLGMLIPAGLFLLTAIPLQRFLVRQTKSIGISLLPLLLIVPLLAAGFRYLVPAGERTECLYPRENAYTHTTAGTITAVRPADHIPLYYYDGEFRGGVLVTMDGVEYYSMAHPLLTVGTSLHFTYCPEEDLIMAFSPIAAEDVSALQKPFVMPAPVPEEPVPELQVIIGTVLVWIGLGGLALAVFFSERLTLSYTISLMERDLHQRGEVIPNPSAAAVNAVGLVPVCFAALGGAIARNAWGILFILLLGTPMGLFYSRFAAAHVRLEGRNIRIRRFGRERTVPVSTLRAAYWSQHKKSFTNRKLVLVFDGWTLDLDQDSHLGLADLHRRLSAILHITQ